MVAGNPENSSDQYLSFDEAQPLILDQMRDAPGDCNLYGELESMIDINLRRSVGATQKGVNDTMVQLMTIHQPHCEALNTHATID